MRVVKSCSYRATRKPCVFVRCQNILYVHRASLCVLAYLYALYRVYTNIYYIVLTSLLLLPCPIATHAHNMTSTTRFDNGEKYINYHYNNNATMRVCVV